MKDSDLYLEEPVSAQVKTEGLRGALLGYSSKRFRILDMSRGGLAFESEKPYKTGQKIDMLVDLPGRDEPLELHGEVRWQKDVLNKYVLVTVGVQFAPFGDEKGMNSPEVLQVLEQLEEQYGYLEEAVEKIIGS